MFASGPAWYITVLTIEGESVISTTNEERPAQDRPSNEPRVNHRIRVPLVRVIGPDGAQLGVIPTEEAKRIASDAGLDLVEVQPNQRPPVCKILDYGKHKYDQKKRANETKKKQHIVETKEMKFRPKTDTHDFEVKVRKLREFLTDGNKGRVVVLFSGREIIHKDIGADICKRVALATEDLAVIEAPPRMEGRIMLMLLSPKKKS